MIAFTAGSLGDVLATAGLAAQVVKVLYDNRNLAKECETLGIELQSLQTVLIMVDFALQRYGLTPLGEPLAHFIRPEVAQCHISLKVFSDKVIACQQALSLSTIGSLWQKVVWAASDEAASLSAKLANHRLKLVTLLITLNSVGWMDSGQYSRLSLEQMTTQNGPRIRSIKDNTIDVVDPMGEIIPVPILFCATWEGFDHVIKGFSRNRIGQRYVDQGDYQIVQPKGDKVIDRLDLCKMKEGETIEISIILRPKKIKENLGICPRCAHLNVDAQPNGGWIKCFRCSGLFHITTVWNLHDKMSDGNSDNNDGSLDVDLSPFPQVPITQQDMESDAKYFRRITIATPVKTTALKTQNRRSALTRALGFARDAVQKDSTNDNPHSAVDAYAQSVALIKEVIVGATSEGELRRLQNIRDTYADRMNILQTIYDIPDPVTR